MLESELARQIVETVRSRLADLEQAAAPGTPLYDVKWLRRRCEATLGMHGNTEHWCNLSLRQLKKDVAVFHEEFPGFLDPELVAALVNTPVRT